MLTWAYLNTFFPPTNLQLQSLEHQNILERQQSPLKPGGVHWARPVCDCVWRFNLQVWLLLLVFVRQRMPAKQWISCQDSLLLDHVGPISNERQLPNTCWGLSRDSMQYGEACYHILFALIKAKLLLPLDFDTCCDDWVIDDKFRVGFVFILK